MSKIKLSLRVAIVLLTLCAVFLAWLAWNRNRNSDRLQAVLEKVGPENVDVTNSGIEPDDGWWENLLADTSPRPGELRFFSVSNELADLLAASQATDQITSLTLVHYSKNNAFFNGRTVIGDSGEFDPPLSNKSNSGDQPFVADDCNMFFKAWQNLVASHKSLDSACFLRVCEELKAHSGGCAHVCCRNLGKSLEIGDTFSGNRGSKTITETMPPPHVSNSRENVRLTGDCKQFGYLGGRIMIAELGKPRVGDGASGWGCRCLGVFQGGNT